MQITITISDDAKPAKAKPKKKQQKFAATVSAHREAAPVPRGARFAVAEPVQGSNGRSDAERLPDV